MEIKAKCRDRAALSFNHNGWVGDEDKAALSLQVINFVIQSVAKRSEGSR